MARYDTSKGNSVAHYHDARIMSSAETREAREWMEEHFPDTTHLRVASWKYNCHGYAYADAHAWFNYPTRFIDDDFTEVPLDSAQKEDVLLYTKRNKLTHSAIVTRVSGGEIRRVRSKWGVLPAVSHDPTDVLPSLGKPKRLLRPVFARLLALHMEGTIMDEKEFNYVLQRSIARFSDPEINYQVMIASSPEGAEAIIEELPGVEELIQLGPEAVPPVLELLQTEETLNNYRLSAVALYILQRLPSPEVKQALAGPIISGRFQGLNSQLAAEAFLRSAGIEVNREDAVDTALNEAQKIQSEKAHESKY